MWNCKNWYIRDFIVKHRTLSMFLREEPEITEDRNEEFAIKGSTIVDFIRIFILSCGFLMYRRRISHNTTNLADFVRSSVLSRTIIIRSRKNRNCPYKIFQRELPSFFWNGIVVTTLTLTYFMFYSAYVRISITLATGCPNKILSNSFTILFHRLRNDLVNNR